MSFEVGAWWNDKEDFNKAFEHGKEKFQSAYQNARKSFRKSHSNTVEAPVATMEAMPPSEEGMPDMGSFKDFLHRKEEELQTGFHNLQNRFSHHQAAAPAAAAAAAPAMDDATPDAAPNMGMMRHHGGGGSMGGY